MKESYSDYAGFTPSEQSDVMIRLKVLAGEIYKERAYAEYILRQMFPSTAVGEYLDLHAAERGLTRRQATKATGYAAFYPSEETHDSILIPAGTIVSTIAGMRRYVTDSDVTLSASQDYVTAPITAIAEGADYNAVAGMLGIIVTPVIGIGRVVNGSPITGGADTESDEALRARVKASYETISNGANAAYYQSLAMSVSGIGSASVVGGARGAGTVNVYVLGSDGSTVTAAKLSEVQTLLSAERELNVDVRACHPEEIDISLYIRLKVQPGYSFNAVADQVRSAVEDFIDGLGIGRDVLLCEIGELIYHIKGVADYKFLESYGSDCAISNAQFACADVITVREV